jgi:pyridoxamine-phosphate oxidase
MNLNSDSHNNNNSDNNDSDEFSQEEVMNKFDEWYRQMKDHYNKMINNLNSSSDNNSNNNNNSLFEWIKTEYEPNAMCICSLNHKNLQPSSRNVLMKQYNTTTGEFIFYTNYESRKGKELLSNNKISIVFYWSFPIARQVRIEGNVFPLSSEKSDEYFDSRVNGSKITSIISKQSSEIPNRSFSQLHEEYTTFEKQTKKDSSLLKRPSYWGGFKIEPNSIEFWEKGKFRLAKREKYEKIINLNNDNNSDNSNSNWKLKLLYP